jgi:hypothetical protein
LASAFSLSSDGLFGCSARLLPHHFIRLLIFPNPKKDRLSETIIPGPLGEFYLADHHRLDPTATLHFGQALVPTVAANCRKVVKGTFFNPDFV